MARNNVATTYTDKSGKFAKGNPGRPKGSRHKHVLAIQDLLDGEAETLGRKAATVMGLVERYRRLLELSEFEGRLLALERATQGPTDE